jgi:hypothetical protein
MYAVLKVKTGREGIGSILRQSWMAQNSPYRLPWFQRSALGHLQ